MARFILDIDTANKTENREYMLRIAELLYEDIASITCINQSNDTQFHEYEEDNKLTEDEVKTFNNNPHG